LEFVAKQAPPVAWNTGQASRCSQLGRQKMGDQDVNARKQTEK